MKILSIAGARPNFMKVAPLAYAIERHNQQERQPWIEHRIVHTGQHYDQNMSDSFFEELAVPKPHYNLEAGSGSHSVQTAQIMTRFEPVLLEEKPDVLVLVGDVNSTVACALVAVKINYDGTSTRPRPLIAHVEAGLRSRDRTMPEEINRILTDALSDLLFVTEQDAIANLKHEGIAKRRIHFVGNVMIDTLLRHREKARSLKTLASLLDSDCRDPLLRSRLTEPGKQSGYGLITLHRPSNVDSPQELKSLMDCLGKISRRVPLIFPLHPRTRKNLEQYGLPGPEHRHDGILYTNPLGYLEFLNLLLDARLVLTDSGGIQEEATFLGVPCITLRNNTERPVTTTVGTNYLVGTNPDRIMETAYSVIEGTAKKGSIPSLWDGEAGGRIVEILAKAAAL